MMAVYWGIEYFVSFVETLMCFVFCGAFLNKDGQFRFKIPIVLSVLISVGIISLGRVKLFSSINSFLTVLVTFICIMIFYHAAFIRTIITFIPYCTILFTADLMTSSLTASISGTTISELFNNFSAGRVVAAVTSKGIITIICITINRIKTKETSISIGNNVLFSASSIILLLVSVSLYFSYSKEGNEHTNLTLTIFFMVILLLIVAIFISITFFIESMQKRKENELMADQNQLLERSLKEQEKTFSLWRNSVHDYKNTILAMETMLNNGEQEKLSQFLEAEHAAFRYRAEYIHTGNSIVDAVINTKYATAKEKGINFTVNAVMPSKCNVSDIHLAVIMGNLIDNALEACENEQQPYIDVEIIVKHSFMIIKIVNKCTNMQSTDATSKKNKKEFHGIGLKSVRHIIDEYDGDFNLTFDGEKAEAKVLMKI